jgi:cell wall-associated NlpC family hydrolase
MKKFYKIGWCFLFTVSFILAGMSANSWADRTYTVKKGDSLYKISKRFKTDTSSITEVNGLASDKLALGTRLIIPSREPNKEVSSTLSNISRGNIPDNNAADNIAMLQTLAQRTGQSGPITHEVKNGDSLWKIAKKYSKTVSELKKLNNLGSSRLKLSQKLIIEPQPEVIEKAIPVITQKTPDPAGAEIEKSIDATLSTHNNVKEFLMFVAEKTIGIPYKFGSNSFKSTDCSGYVQKVFSFIGIQLPRSAREQFSQGVSVNKKDLSIGDLVFFRTYASFPSHVGIYLGNNLFIHASSIARKVTIDSLNTSYFVKRFIGAKRLQGLNEMSLTEPHATLETAVQ